MVDCHSPARERTWTWNRRGERRTDWKCKERYSPENGDRGNRASSPSKTEGKSALSIRHAINVAMPPIFPMQARAFDFELRLRRRTNQPTEDSRHTLPPPLRFQKIERAFHTTNCDHGASLCTRRAHPRNPHLPILKDIDNDTLLRPLIRPLITATCNLCPSAPPPLHIHAADPALRRLLLHRPHNLAPGALQIRQGHTQHSSVEPKREVPQKRRAGRGRKAGCLPRPLRKGLRQQADGRGGHGGQGGGGGRERRGLRRSDCQLRGGPGRGDEGGSPADAGREEEEVRDAHEGLKGVKCTHIRAIKVFVWTGLGRGGLSRYVQQQHKTAKLVCKTRIPHSEATAATLYNSAP